MCCSRISRAASTTDADAPIERGSSVIALLTLFAIGAPLASLWGHRADYPAEWRMDKPRIFLGSSGKQAKLLRAITRGLEDVAEVEPWTTTFNPGRSTLDRLVELSQEVDFAAFVFAQDDWTTTDAAEAGQASPRDNVVVEAGAVWGPRRGPEGDRSGLAGRRHAVVPLLERGHEGAQGSGGHHLLLEGGTPQGPGCPAARGSR